MHSIGWLNLRSSRVHPITLATETAQCAVSPSLCLGWDYSLCSLKPQASSLAVETTQCTIPIGIQTLLPMKIVQSFPSYTHLLYDHALKINLLKLMFSCHECPFVPHVKHFLPTVIVTMIIKRASSKGTTESSIGEEVEQTPIDSSVYADT